MDERDTLRRALEPDAETVDHVVRHALAGPRPRSTPRIGTRVLAAAFLVVMLGLVAWLARTPEDDAKAPVHANPPAIADSAETGEVSGKGPLHRLSPADVPSPLRITNLDGPLTVSTDAGTRWIVLDDT